MGLTEFVGEDVTPDEEVGRLLASMAAGAVGEEHVDDDRFRAVNEALLAVLNDRIASMRLRETDDQLWSAAFGDADIDRGLSLNEAAKLNRLLHFAPATPDGDGAERGAVINLPEEISSGEGFSNIFDLPPEVAAEKQFLHKQADQTGKSLDWVLVQTQAACDYAQTQPGPLPFHLGLCVPESKAQRRKPPAALWRSPYFELHGQTWLLHVNSRFQISLPRGNAQQMSQRFRLREQLLNDLIYQIHGYAARPGIVSFRGSR